MASSKKNRQGQATANSKASDQDKVEEAKKPAEVALLVLNLVSEYGSLTEAEICEHLTRDEYVPERTVRQAIIKIDRSGLITRPNEMEGFQVTGKGEDAMKKLAYKAVASYVAPYADWATVRATYTLLGASLGPITTGAQVGLSTFPRLPDGSIIFYGGWFRAALQKAFERIDITIVDVLSGNLKNIPKAAWQRVTIDPYVFPADLVLEKRIRRPVNNRRESVGEIVHEALPAGTTFTVSVTLPLSHFQEAKLRPLFQTAGRVGFSPAGSGLGGNWGVAKLDQLEIDRGDGEALLTRAVTLGFTGSTGVVDCGGQKGSIPTRPIYVDGKCFEGEKKPKEQGQ